MAMVPLPTPYLVQAVFACALFLQFGCHHDSGNSSRSAPHAIQWRGISFSAGEKYTLSLERDRVVVRAVNSSGASTGSGIVIGFGSEHANLRTAFDNRLVLCPMTSGCLFTADTLGERLLQCVQSHGNGREAEAYRHFICRVSELELYALGSCDARVNSQCEDLLAVFKAGAMAAK